MKVILAPHLDDEIIGCYSILHQIDWVVYWKRDYRVGQITPPWPGGPKYRPVEEVGASGTGRSTFSWADVSTLYLPSRYDYHPLHREVNRYGLGLPGQKMFYSVEMNVPWLEEEEDPVGKRALLAEMYPGEVETLSKSDKYFLFRSIQPFDEIIWASVRFTHEAYHCWPAAPSEVEFLRHPHRHLFHFQVDVQQFGNDRDLEYFILSRKVQKFVREQDWPMYTSCEMFAQRVRRWLEHTYPDRQVQVSVYEDGENGCRLE